MLEQRAVLLLLIPTDTISIARKYCIPAGVSVSKQQHCMPVPYNISTPVVFVNIVRVCSNKMFSFPQKIGTAVRILV